jgi:ParB-like chromosome segregation protein Spo0J
MKIKERKIAELNPAEYNPRQLTDKQYKQLKKSLKTFGCVEPVVVNKNPMRKDVIIGGHQRCKVWADLGNDTIPTVEIELGEAEEMELNVRLNKNTGEFDFDMLANYYDQDQLMEWGFSEKELLYLSYDDEIDGLDEDDEIELPQSVQLEPPKEYIIILCEPNSVEWEQLKMKLKLGLVRKGGYKKGSAFDSISTERVLTYKNFIERYDNSSTIEE